MNYNYELYQVKCSNLCCNLPAVIWVLLVISGTVRVGLGKAEHSHQKRVLDSKSTRNIIMMFNSKLIKTKIVVNKAILSVFFFLGFVMAEDLESPAPQLNYDDDKRMLKLLLLLMVVVVLWQSSSSKVMVPLVLLLL